MYSDRERRAALAVLARGGSLSDASRATGIARATLRSWLTQPVAGRDCPVCGGAPPPPAAAYAALLGFYLGDGCVSRVGRTHSLRVSCDARLPGIVDDVEASLRAVAPTRRTSRVSAPGVVVVQAYSTHWPCLFPQHGPGRKHERPIVLDDWQRRLVEAEPAAFLRGLFHSDGCRVRNWAQRRVADEVKRYDYPRWQFVNASADIRELCCWALDLVEVDWRQSNARVISVSRREAVRRLDALIGEKR